MIQHHPQDDLLLPLAAGRLALGPALVLGVHLESCAQCRERVRVLRAVGGALLDESAPLPLADDALAKTWARIDAPDVPRAAQSIRVPAAPLPIPAGMRWPTDLGGCTTSGWRWMGPGMRYARLCAPGDPDAKLYLLRIAEGRSLASHSHRGMELTQVLCGSFDDGRATFAPGDFDATDDDVRHQPVVSGGGECICLAYVEGSLRFDGRVASMIAGWIGM
jgi:putative transcriptional regulator